MQSFGRRWVNLWLAGALLLGWLGWTAPVRAAAPAAAMRKVVVVLRLQPDWGALRALDGRRVAPYLRQFAAGAQFLLLGQLRAWQAQGKVGQITPLWIVDAVSLEAAPEVVAWLEQHPAVLEVRADDDPHNAIRPLDLVYPGTATVETNLAQVNAPALWAMGYQGQGVTVAIMDTGVDVSHPDLAAQWRGGTNSWFDPYGQYSTPVDIAGSNSGHGTAVAGVILGRNQSGRALGAAPQAQWIAARLYDSGGHASETAVHLAYQWVLDPDGDPLTNDTPQVVNSSWGFISTGCNQTFRADVQALLAAGILPVFAAGNNGPSSGSSISPANYPESLAVGAVDGSDQLYTYSSRGPNACDAGQVFPTLSAPGVNIYSTDLFGMYYHYSGTSMAAPHAAGALALLLSFEPGMSPARQREALVQGVLDLGDPGPDDLYGYGRLDVYQSWYWMALGDAPQRVFLPVIVQQ